MQSYDFLLWRRFTNFALNYIIFSMKRVITILFSLFISFYFFCGSACAISENQVAGQVSDILVSSGESDSRLEETSLGSVTADAACFVSDADISIIHGGIFSANLTGGDVTYADCKGVFREDIPLCTITVSPQEVRNILEFCVSQAQVTREEYLDREKSVFDCFPQISGFTFLYDLSAPPGDRVVWIQYEGQELDLTDTTRTLNLCTTEPILSGAGIHGQPADSELVSTALFSYIEAHDGPVQQPQLGRIRTRGSNESGLFSSLGISPLFLFVVLICFGVVASHPFKKYYDFKR